MPTAGALYGTALVSSTFYPYSITIGSTEVAPGNAQLESIEFEENGDDDPGYCRMRIWDSTNSVPIRATMVVRVHDNTLGTQVWLGTVINHSMESAAVGRWISVEAVTVSAMIDELLVPLESRQAESDRQRVAYLWGLYAKYPLDPDVSQIAQTNAAISADLMSGQTLRAALAQTASLSGSTVHFHVDSLGRLVWRAGNPATTAPFNINVALSPGGGNIAPDDLTVTRDGTIKNRLYIRGNLAAGSGWFQDDASVAQYGPREDYVDAPSSDTAAEALTIAQLQLGKTAQPNVRASFSTTDPNSGWRADQMVTVTSPADDLAAQVLRIVKVTTSFWRGDGKRLFRIDAGWTGARLSGIPSQPATQFISASVGQPAFVVRRRLRFIDDNGVEVGVIFASQGGIVLNGAVGTATEIGPRRQMNRAIVDPVAATTLTAECELLYLTPSGGPIVMTAVPTLDAGITDQIVHIINLNAVNVTLQDDGTLAGSNLQMSTATFVMGQYDAITFISVTGGVWVEIARSNN